MDHNDKSSEPFRLIPLKTTLELRPGDVLIDVYVTKVPVKAANRILNVIRSAVVETEPTNLQHLRRFSKAQDLPSSLRNTITVVPAVESDTQFLYLLAGPVSSLSQRALKECILEALPEFSDEQVVHKIAVPIVAPTSQEQADNWSSIYWPTIYRKSNPFGPHPSIVERAEAEISRDLSLWMSMATEIAAKSKSTQIGESVGAVVVDRSNDGAKAVALAADARWLEGVRNDRIGNPMAHAVLRAIAMVAQKLKKGRAKFIIGDATCGALDEETVFSGEPLLSDELTVFNDDNISKDGYLCHGLEIYLTHEPCVMCSMALLHSRFGRVVFGQRMPMTGGLGSETRATPSGAPTLGWGLFWRRDLNWSMLAWQLEWKSREEDTSDLTIEPKTQA